MRLKKIFKEQKKFQKNFYNVEKLTYQQQIKLTKEFVLCIHKELSEILDTIPWKLHRTETIVYPQEHTLEEIIDVFKFLLNLCIIWKIDDSSFINAFYKKSNIVMKRQHKERLKRNTTYQL